MMDIFRKVPPAISVPLFYVFFTFQVVSQFLFGSYIGVLLGSAAIYIAVDIFTQIHPLSFGDLLLWASNLEQDYKVALVSSMVTVIGFVVAFNTATRNWQGQLNAQLKMHVASEVEHFFGNVTSDINNAEIHVNALIETINRIQRGCTFAEAHFSIKYNQEKAAEFFSTRMRLSAASVEVHRIQGRHYNVLSTGWSLLSYYGLAADAVKNVSQAMWVHIPIVDLNDPNHVQDFVNQLNVVECLNFVKVCEASGTKISGLAGGIRGYLLAPVVGFNWSMYSNLVSNRKGFREAIEELYKKLNGSG